MLNVCVGNGVQRIEEGAAMGGEGGCIRPVDERRGPSGSTGVLYKAWHGRGHGVLCLAPAGRRTVLPRCAFQGLTEVVVGNGGRWESDPSSALYEQGLVALPFIFSLTLSLLTCKMQLAGGGRIDPNHL